jgi:HAD superfamily hydrolase (TIGR01549 family)
VTRAYRTLLFDLFGTVAQFTTAPGAARGSFEWLRDAFAEHRPALAFDDFRRALLEVSSALAAERALEHREVPSRERFRRALSVVDAGGAPAVASALGVRPHVAAAEALSLAHMAHLATQTEVPAAHVDLLRELTRRYRLGLVSNFDHAPTAHAILARDGLQGCFAAVLISDDFGRRKPHPSIFHAALDRLNATPDEALFVGDTLTDDVCGAQAAGIDVAWLNRHGVEPCDPGPTYILRELNDLRTLLCS